MPAIVDKAAKRADIIRSAADVFSRRGYHATRMADVADVTGIGKGTIYEYFATKEDLFLAIYDSWMTEFEGVVQSRYDKASNPMDRVDAIRDSAVEFYQSKAAQASLLLEFWAHALRAENPAFLERVQKTRLFLRNLGVTITNELVKGGWFTPVQADSFTELETGISDGIFLSWLLGGQTFPLDKAYKFRQSVIGLGLLSKKGRVILSGRLQTKLKKGFK